MEGKDNVVYKHISPTGKVYIGITKISTAKRWGRGTGYVRNHHLYAAIKKYGWDNFSHEIVATGLSRSEASKMEQELIAAYHSNESESGYNLTSGGDSNYNVSDKTREIHSQKQKSWLAEHPEHIEKLKKVASKTIKNAWQSAEYRERIIPALKKAHKEVYDRKPELREFMGKRARAMWNDPVYRERFTQALCSRTQSDETRRRISAGQFKISVLCVDTNETFESISAAAKFAGVMSSCIADCCNGKSKTSGGYSWRYASESDDDWKKRRSEFVALKTATRRKKVLCVETGQIFQSAQAAARYINNAEGGTQQSILKCCRGERKSTHGYHWEYAD